MSGNEKGEFREYSRCVADKSSVWQYFLRSTDGQLGQCKICKKVLKTSGTTTSLRNHVKLVHLIKLDQKITNVRSETTFDVAPSTSATSTGELQSLNQAKKPRKIDDYYVPQNEDTMETMIVKMVAIDGLPFRVFCTSESIRKLFHKAGHKSLPKSPNTIKSIVMGESIKLKTTVKEHLQRLKDESHKFTVSLDEWTSARNRRYVNMIVHSSVLDKGFINLGLTKISGSGTASNILNILDEKLADFGLFLNKDIACLVTDGASVMCSLGRMVSSYHQLCLAHGIQCAVLDVLYKKDVTEPLTHPTTYSDSDDEGDEDDSEEIHGFSVSIENSNSSTNVPKLVYKDIITKIRKIIKYFKNSPTRTDLLNTYITAPTNKKLALVLDCKTRWSSLADMVTRFLQLKEPIQKALIDLKDSTTFTEDEISLLQDLSKSLNIIKATVEEICEQKSNLLTAETALKFMLDKLNELDDTISRQLVIELSRRITQRRNVELVSTLKYLHNPIKFYEESESNTSHIFPHASNNIIFETILNINKNFFPKSTDVQYDEEDDLSLLEIQRQQATNETVNETVPKTIKQQLKEKVMESLKTTTTTSTRSLLLNEDLETTLRVEMAQFDRGGGAKGIHLLQAYQFLLTIMPTSVEPERVFSANRLFCTHLRSSFSDETLDALSFLRFYYLNKKKY